MVRFTGDASANADADAEAGTAVEVEVTMRDSLDVVSGAFVLCGEAGRLRWASVSRGCEAVGMGLLRRLMAEGVGVKGGGLMGDLVAVLRFLGRGVEGAVNGAASEVLFGEVEAGAGSVVWDGLVLRFLGAVVVVFFSAFL